MIVNIRPGVFGSTIRMGDQVAIANVVEHFRITNSDQSIRFYIDPRALDQTSYCGNFYQFMLDNTNYFSADKGDFDLPWQRVNIWDYRDIAGDLVKIPNNLKSVKKIVVNPLFDATYNTYRNWTDTVFQEVLEWCESTFPNYELVLISQKPLYKHGWHNVNDLYQVLKEIMAADTYVGGDTGLSHFVGALERGPDPIYYYSSRGLLHTTPINWMTNRKGHMRTFWHDFEGTKW